METLINVFLALAIVWFLVKNAHELVRHFHKCPTCCHVWSHRGIMVRWSHTAHTCPKCGSEQYIKTYHHPCARR
jgi:predicted RNA-binding Zn-ribbon protein involved in translation (DUF1610 family)